MTTLIQNTINLENNYYLEIIENKENLPCNVFDIKNIKSNKFLKKQNCLILIDFDSLMEYEYKKVLKKLLRIKNIMLRKNRHLGVEQKSQFLLGYILNYDRNNKMHNNFISAINAISFDTKYERYNYIYDKVCDYLDSFFYGKNLCDFKDNRCQNGKASTQIGCCRHFKHKRLGPFSKFIPCEHLSEDKTCGAKCISCKLFTCPYLEKKGIKFKINEILLLNVFFNPIQKYFIKTMVFTPKEKIIRRLLIFS